MKPKILFILLILFLAGCTKTIYKNPHIELELPEGCEINVMQGVSMEPRIMQYDKMIACRINNTEPIEIGEIACYNINEYCKRVECHAKITANNSCHWVVGVEGKYYIFKANKWFDIEQKVKRNEIVGKIRGILI